jgi:hypothetical protein
VREASALELRLTGETFATIGRELGVTESSARKAYERSLERLNPIPQREEARALEAARLDRLQVVHWQKALSGDVGATSTVLAIMGRRARLLGLDAPTDATLDAVVRVVHELRRLPDGDLLQLLGYENEDTGP